MPRIITLLVGLALVASTAAAAKGLHGPHADAAAPHEAAAPLAALAVRAADGDAEAQYRLGRAYFVGLPTLPKDQVQAHHWLSLAAAAHHPVAAYDLGVMSRNGDGVPVDPREAARWFALAAEAGSASAMFMLANAYRAGEGVPRNDAKAVALYERAGELGHGPSLQTLAMAYSYGELGLEADASAARLYFEEAEHAALDRHDDR